MQVVILSFLYTFDPCGWIKMSKHFCCESCHVAYHIKGKEVYSKTCVKRRIKNRQSKDLNEKW